MTDDRRIRVLFMCVHNSCRSQMAQGFLNAMAPASFEASSAGSEATRLHPLAIQVSEREMAAIDERSKRFRSRAPSGS